MQIPYSTDVSKNQAKFNEFMDRAFGDRVSKLDPYWEEWKQRFEAGLDVAWRKADLRNQAIITEVFNYKGD